MEGTLERSSHDDFQPAERFRVWKASIQLPCGVEGQKGEGSFGSHCSLDTTDYPSRNETFLILIGP